jgi:hypothetical protein
MRIVALRGYRWKPEGMLHRLSDSETIQIQTANYDITRQRHALVLIITRDLLLPEGFTTLRIP